jgi:chromosome segregation ATPase
LERYDTLKKLATKYAEILKGRRDTLRSLSASLDSSEPLLGFERSGPQRRAENLKAQRTKHRLDRAEAETLLARRKKAADKTEPIRKEIAQLEDRLAILTAQQKVVDEELEGVARQKHSHATLELDRKEITDEITQLEHTAVKIGAEIEALSVELTSPPRVRVIEEAVATR